MAVAGDFPLSAADVRHHLRGLLDLAISQQLGVVALQLADLLLGSGQLDVDVRDLRALLVLGELGFERLALVALLAQDRFVTVQRDALLRLRLVLVPVFVALVSLGLDGGLLLLRLRSLSGSDLSGQRLVGSSLVVW